MAGPINYAIISALNNIQALRQTLHRAQDDEQNSIEHISSDIEILDPMLRELQFAHSPAYQHKDNVILGLGFIATICGRVCVECRAGIEMNMWDPGFMRISRRLANCKDFIHIVLTVGRIFADRHAPDLQEKLVDLEDSLSTKLLELGIDILSLENTQTEVAKAMQFNEVSLHGITLAEVIGYQREVGELYLSQNIYAEFKWQAENFDLHLEDLRAEQTAATAPIVNGSGQYMPHTNGNVPHTNEAVPHTNGAVPHTNGAVPHTNEDSREEQRAASAPIAGGSGLYTNENVPHTNEDLHEQQRAASAPIADGSGPYMNGAVPHTNGDLREEQMAATAPVVNGDAPIANGSAPYTNGVVPYADGIVPYADGNVPYTTGIVPYTTGIVPYIIEYVPQTNGYVPQTNRYMPQTNGYVLQTNGYMPQTNGYMPQTNGYVPQTNGYVPQTNGYVPQTNGYVLYTNGDVPHLDLDGHE